MYSLDELHAIGTELENSFCLREAAIAIKLIDRDDIPEGCEQPSKDGKHYALCQALSFVRRTRNSMAVFKEDHWCVWPVVNMKLTEVTEEDTHYLGDKYFIRDPVASYNHWMKEYPYINDDKKKEGMALAPLTGCTFIPDAIMIYCNPSQLRQFLMAAKYDTANIVTSCFDTCDSCGAALLPILNGEKDYNVSIPDAGEYERGLVTENDMIFTLSGEVLPLFVQAIRDLQVKGFSYKQLSYDLKTDYARPEFYDNMFKKWGLATGELWTPGKR